MLNRTLTFTMSAYSAMDGYKHGMLCVFLLLYVMVLLLNSTVVGVIYQNQELHQPMNVFTCMLSVNEIYGSTALLPSTMVVLLVQNHQMSVRWCQAQVFFLHTYASAEFNILAVMGYDRYMAICHPLHYHAIMSRSKVCRLAALAGLFPIIAFGGFYCLTSQLSFCVKVIPKLYCSNMELVKTSCYSAPYINIVGLSVLIVFVCPQLIMVFFSYAHIVKVCRKLSKESQTKALNTCVPHILSVVNYSIGGMFEVLQSRFNMNHVAMEVRTFMSLYFLVIPAIINPVLYGVGIQLVRASIFKLFIRTKIQSNKVAT